MMTKPVRFDAEAEEEFTAAAGWYERERPGLGGEFVVSVNETVLEVRERPETFSLVPTVPQALGVRSVSPTRSFSSNSRMKSACSPSHTARGSPDTGAIVCPCNPSSGEKAA